MIGTQFDHYEIIAPLGSGGMGEVYLALDHKLERKVALKVLPEEYTQDEERVRRFQNEAKAVSALNHPNIVTIHEIGQHEHTNFIVTEYIEGETLRQRLKHTRLTLRQVLEIGTQIAGALDAAHTAGIIHRDIKPDNVMLRPDGYVKVLDFGLAKLTEREADANAETSLSVELFKTNSGVILGTASYMSPEQARGQRVDARTDIFSFGSLLYEMVAGLSPFANNSPGEVIAAILHQEPPTLARYAPQTPQELERIVRKTLAKDREERYQTMKDLLIDLRNLRRSLNFDSGFDHSGASAENMVNVSANGDASTDPYATNVGVPAAVISPNIGSTAVLTSPPGATAQAWQMPMKTAVIALESKQPNIFVPGSPVSQRRSPAAWLAAGIALLLGFIALAWWMMERNRGAVPATGMKLTRLTISGPTLEVALSPDAKYVAYVLDEGEQRSLCVKQALTNSNPVCIVPTTTERLQAPIFSRDGNHVFYQVNEAQSGVLYQIPTLGGSVRKIASGVAGHIAHSPDHSQIAFLRALPEQGASALVIANQDGTNERELVRRKLPDFFAADGPGWSPDGKLLAVGAGNSATRQQVLVVSISDGTSSALTATNWGYVGRVIWLPESRGILFLAAEQNSGLRQVWQAAYPSGTTQRLTNDLNNYISLSAAADGKTLVTVQQTQLSGVRTLRVADETAAPATGASAHSYDGLLGVSWLGTQRVIYSSQPSGRADLWVMNADGSEPRQLTTEGHNSAPAGSPDGKFVLFSSERNGTTTIWRVNSEGSDARQLTSGPADSDPQWLTNNQIVYSSISSGKRSLWKVSSQGGTPTPLLQQYAEAPVVSADGRQIACLYREDAPNAKTQIAVLAANTGTLLHKLDIPATAWHTLQFAPDGSALTYVETQTGVSNLWSQPLTGGQPRRLTNFNADRIFAYRWSRDGRQIVYARGVESRDVVLISNLF